MNIKFTLLKHELYVSCENFNSDEGCYDEESEDKLINVKNIRNELMEINYMKALFSESKKINSCEETN